MTKEAKQKFQDLLDQQGKILINITESMTDQVKEKYGKDVATGFVLGMDMAYLALTGKDMPM